MTSLTSSSFSNDAIGETTYSKKWLLDLLRKLIKYCEEDDASDAELDPNLEEGLCILWDMTSNEDVQKCLSEFKGHDIFFNAILATQKPRLVEISIGILANLVHNDEINSSLSNPNFCSTILSLLSSTDIPVLLQTIRLLNTVLHKTPDQWLSVIEENAKTFFEEVQYLFSCCLNVDFLKSMFQFINDLLYKKQDLGRFWWQDDNEFKWISSLCQACYQILSSIDAEEDSIIDSRFFFNFWFIIEMLFCDDYNQELRNFDLFDHLTELKELFARFNCFLDCSSKNSICSYSAACLVITKCIKILETCSSNSQDQINNSLSRLKIQMADNSSISSTMKQFFTFLKEEHNNTEEDQTFIEEITPNIKELYGILYK